MAPRSSLWPLLLLAGCGGVDPAPAITPPEPPSLHTRALALGERVKTEVDCAASPWRWMCALTHLEGGAVALPASPTARLGLVVSFRPSQPLLFSAERTATVGLLVIDPAAPQLAFDTLRPTERLDAQGLASLAGPLAAALRSGTADAPLLPPVAEAILRLPPVEAGAPEPDEDGLGFHGPPPTEPGFPATETRLFHTVHDGMPMWVAVRSYGEGGFVGVFPDVDPKILKQKPEAPASQPEASPPGGAP